jgi:hypothetical protein
MPRETKAEIALCKANELKAKERAEKAAAKKAEKLAAATTSNIVVVDFSDDTKNLIKLLIAAISAAPVAQAKEPYSKAAPMQSVPVAQATTNAVAEQAELFPEAQTGTSLTEIRSVIQLKVSEKKTNAVVSLLSEFGAANAQSLEQKDWDSFYAKLQNL